MKVRLFANQVLVESSEGWYIPVGRVSLTLGDAHVPGEGALVLDKGRPVREEDITRIMERESGIAESHRAAGFPGADGKPLFGAPVDLSPEEAMRLLRDQAASEYRQKQGWREGDEF